MIYQGSCHCGNIAFTVDGEISGAMDCNCSICLRKGTLMWFVPRSSFTLTSEKTVGTYTFNKHVINHRFCQVCGIHPFGDGVDPKGNEVVSVNLRCIEGIDLASIPVQHFDGRSKP